METKIDLVMGDDIRNALCIVNRWRGLFSIIPTTNIESIMQKDEGRNVDSAIFKAIAPLWKNATKNFTNDEWTQLIIAIILQK